MVGESGARSSSEVTVDSVGGLASTVAASCYNRSFTIWWKEEASECHEDIEYRLILKAYSSLCLFHVCVAPEL